MGGELRSPRRWVPPDWIDAAGQDRQATGSLVPASASGSAADPAATGCD